MFTRLDFVHAAGMGAAGPLAAGVRCTDIHADRDRPLRPPKPNPKGPEKGEPPETP